MNKIVKLISLFNNVLDLSVLSKTLIELNHSSGDCV